ncbi:MAG: site-specific DNA-methyltransferase [Thermoanaerobacterales bacterium]|nr:site-specific DNA-methyltransferase [Thermoanaerobacterales bacterium]
MSHHKFFVGDALTVLRQLPAASVDAVVTSPPYWNLRDYGVRGQIGLEKEPEDYVRRLLEVFTEVRRVLKVTGSCWVNLGDTYWGGGQGHDPSERSIYAGRDHLPERPGRAGTRRRDGWKQRKQLLLIPARLAIAMQEAGWILRNDVIWHKPNGMPVSCKDRLSNRHEHLFHFVLRERYYYDLDAIRVPWEGSDLRRRWGRPGDYSDTARGRIPKCGTEEYRQWYHKEREKRSWHDHENDAQMGFGHQGRGLERKQPLPHPDGKNPGDVWSIPVKPFPGHHFATMPPGLVERCLQATTSPAVCPCCGAPWERVRERTGHINRREAAHVPGGGPTKTDSTGWAPLTRGTDRFRPTCRCPDNDGAKAAVVLDPFGGAGTTTIVAMALGRDSVYIDLNSAYARLAIHRAGLGGGMLDCHTYELIDAGGEAGREVTSG